MKMSKHFNSEKAQPLPSPSSKPRTLVLPPGARSRVAHGPIEPSTYVYAPASFSRNRKPPFGIHTVCAGCTECTEYIHTDSNSIPMPVLRTSPNKYMFQSHSIFLFIPANSNTTPRRLNQGRSPATTIKLPLAFKHAATARSHIVESQAFPT